VYSIQHYVIKCVNDLSHVSVFTNKTDRHDLTEILLKVAFNIIIITLCQVNIIHDENNFAKNNVNFLLDWQTTGCFHCHKMIDRKEHVDLVTEPTSNKRLLVKRCFKLTLMCKERGLHQTISTRDTHLRSELTQSCVYDS
jgi:hypothetical protein